MLSRLAPLKTGRWIGLLLLLVFVLEVVFFQLAYRYVPELVGAWRPYSRVLWTKLVFLIVLLGLSLFLFVCREKYQELYGLTEVAFGCVTAWSALPRLAEDHANWPLLLGAMYINVRGLDNWRKGRLARLSQMKRDE